MLNRKYVVSGLVLAALALAAVVAVRLNARSPEPKGPAGSATFNVARHDFVRSVRLNGIVEAVEATSIQAPRLSGQNQNSLVIMRLIRNGATVRPGDTLVE